MLFGYKPSKVELSLCIWEWGRQYRDPSGEWILDIYKVNLCLINNFRDVSSAEYYLKNPNEG